MNYKLNVAKLAENAVKKYFLEKDFSLVYQNYLVPNIGEIDLIMESRLHLIYFIEVRFRSIDNMHESFELDRYWSNFKKFKFIRICDFFIHKNFLKRNRTVRLVAFVAKDNRFIESFKCRFYDLDSGNLFKI